MKCSGIKANGERCRGIAKAGSDYCPAHDPARADARRLQAAKAGRVRASGEISLVKARLREIAEDVLSGKLDTGRGSVAGQVLGVYLRACQQELRQREYDELRGEMIELRELFEQGSAEGRSWTG
jgi:hypothetical protein